MRSLRNWTIVVLLIVFSIAFAPQAGTTVEHGFDLSNLDRSANACVDFNQFANGGWMAHTTRPADQARWGSFSELQDRNQTILKAVVEQLAASAPAWEAQLAGNAARASRGWRRPR